MPDDMFVPAWRPDGKRIVWMEHLASHDKVEALRNALVNCVGWQGDEATRRAHYFRWRRSDGLIVRCHLVPARKVR